MFAILIDGHLYRFSVGSAVPLSCKLITAGDYCIWYYTEDYFVSNHSGNSAGGNRQTNVVYYVSKGIDGFMHDVTQNPRLTKITAEHSEFKPLLDCVNSGKKLSMMHPLVSAIGECIVKEPSYKAKPEDAIPPVK